jgi:hypothetical protein
VSRAGVVPRKRSTHGRSVRLALAGVLCMTTLVIPSRQVAAQEVTSALGLAGGIVAGAYVTTGLYVLKSRATGWVLHSPSELLSPGLEAIPLVAGPIAGTILGYQSPEKLSAAAAWGGIGLVSGGAVGIAMGQLIWGDSEGRWAGGTIGSALGLVVGAIAGAVTARSDDAAPERTSAPYLTFSIPFGVGR